MSDTMVAFHSAPSLLPTKSQFFLPTASRRSSRHAMRLWQMMPSVGVHPSVPKLASKAPPPTTMPTRYAATYSFFRDGRDAAVTRLRRYLDRQDSGIADEPATARALATYLLRGLNCGALTDATFTREELLAFL